MSLEVLVSRPAGEMQQPMRAKTLAFEFEGDPQDKIERCQTPFGAYELQGFPKGYVVSFLWHQSALRIHDRAGLSREGAIDKAQADFNRRVLDCLEPSTRPTSYDAPAATEPRNRPARP